MSNKPQTWVTADSHWGHARIIELCKRPFQNVEEMDEILIKNWNALVAPEDEVYHLGDFAFSSYKGDKLRELGNRLNGTKYLVSGNHDHVTDSHWLVFKWIKDYYELKLSKRTLVVMCHYPLLTWNKAHYGSYMLHGHCHNVLPENTTRMDVGVDGHGYKPLSLDEIMELMQQRKYVPVDKHEEKHAKISKDGELS